MNQLLQPSTKDKSFSLKSWLGSSTQKPFRLSLLINLVIIGLGVYGLSVVTPVVPLFYSLANPDKQLVSKQWLLFLPLLSLLINSLHLILTKLNQELDSFVLRLFSWSTLILQIMLFMITMRIILITS